MSLPYIMGLRADVWAYSSHAERLGALNELENFLAAHDNRTACSIDDANLPERTRGVHYFDENDAERVTLNSSLVDNDQPYQAVETTLHEDRHAHQHFLVENPELVKDQKQLQDLQISEAGGYINSQQAENYSQYRWQPAEADANEAARASTNELYENVFNDTAQYPDYKEMKAQELDDQIELAKYELGDDYKEEARMAMISNYQFKKDQKHEVVIDQGEGTEVQTTEGTELSQEQQLAEMMGSDQPGLVTENEGEVTASVMEKETGITESLQTELTVSAESNQSATEQGASSTSEEEGYDYSYGYGY